MGRKLVQALKDAGVDAIVHDDVFAQNALDEDWLLAVGARGWVVITKDKLIRKRPLEREALLKAGVRAFVFIGGNMSGIEMAETIVSAVAKMRRIIQKTPPPFVARIGSSGDISFIQTFEKEGVGPV